MNEVSFTIKGSQKLSRNPDRKRSRPKVTTASENTFLTAALQAENTFKDSESTKFDDF